MKTCILRGVPSSLRQDGWWLGPITPIEPGPDQPHAAQNSGSRIGRGSGRYALHALLLAGLIVVSQVPGLSGEPHRQPASTAAACSGDDVFSFHAATGLRSLAPAPQQGTAL